MAAACRPVAQALPQRPQWRTSLVVATSQPLPIVPSQSPKSASQVMPHAPAAQAGRALGRRAQTLSQAPQWSAAVSVLTHDEPQRA